MGFNNELNDIAGHADEAYASGSSASSCGTMLVSRFISQMSDVPEANHKETDNMANLDIKQSKLRE